MYEIMANVLDSNTLCEIVPICARQALSKWIPGDVSVSSTRHVWLPAQRSTTGGGERIERARRHLG